MSPLIRPILGLLLMCSGFDIRAQLGMEPQLLSFGDQQVGTQSAPMSATVSNSSNNLLFVSYGQQLDPAFSATSNCIGFPNFLTIAPRGSCAIQYTFSPPAEGPYSGFASVRELGTFNGASVQLTGNGGGGPVIPDVVHADGFEAPAPIFRW